MTSPLHTPETAAPSVKAMPSEAAKTYGFVPNLLAVMAEAPALVNADVNLSRIFEETSLTAIERQVVLPATSFENKCECCVAAHSVIAAMQAVPTEVVEAIRNGQPIADSKLEALRRFTAEVVTTLGWPSESALQAFRKVGYREQQVREVVLGVGMKTLSNYTNHIAGTPLDKAFAKAAWSKAARPPTQTLASNPAFQRGGNSRNRAAFKPCPNSRG